MPSLGPDMEAGTLVQWRVKPGDAVKRGDIVALVETEKGIIDVEIFSDGVVDQLLVPEGTHVAVGTLLAQLNGGATRTRQVIEVGKPSEAPQPLARSAPVPATHAATSTTPTTTIVPPTISSVPSPEAHRRKVSPAARARARELGVDLERVTGTGMGAAITIEDVVRAAQTVDKPGIAEPAHDMRQIIARAMSRSKREIPHYYLSLTCSFAKARAFLDRYNARVDIESRLLPSCVLLKAVAQAAKAMPEFNGFYKDDAFQAASDVHLGVAIAMRGGRLVAPALLNADQKSLAALMIDLRDLATRVRAGHMRSSELSMPTLTVTSFAEEDVDSVIPVIYPPQVAIVGVGAIRERPWVVEGQVRAELTVPISLAADHRVTDGRAGTRFLATIRNALQAPEQL
ncbi:dihydrolipoamide acetyltransferase family protein [Peristeroidobacter soli]|uniref:dihydrolipoamide acetyltransferase family protein n=1 Tax=Peristeroidobacter soli TaxID=2497877 RepID=UPI001C37B69A|nr:dihydrolipoamide acetyltransferase family protein [Peristeroidobacter soli]